MTGLSGGHDDTAAQAHIAVVQYRRLSGSYCPLRIVKDKLDGFIIQVAQRTGRVSHTVARFAGIAAFLRAFGQCKTQIVHHQALRIKQRMVMALYDNQFVFGQILGRDKPWFACAADTQALRWPSV